MNLDWPAIVSRWTHVGTAIVIVGGTVFLRYVLAPAASQLSDDAHAKLKEQVMGTWKKFVHGGIALFLASGLYNYLVVQKPLHQGDKFYHMLMGTKILLALAMFFIASALVGRSKTFDGMRQKSKMWQTVLVVLAAIVVGMSGFAKVAMKGKSAATAKLSVLSDSV